MSDDSGPVIDTDWVDLPKGALDSLAEALGVTAVRDDGRLRGGVASLTSLLDAGPGPGVRRFVMKRYRHAPMITSTVSPRQFAQLEWERLTIAQHAPIATPAPVLLDADGDLLGMPLVIMSALTGQPTMSPVSMDVWIEGLAAALAAVHSTVLGGPMPAVLDRPHLWQTWTPWDGLGALTADVITVVEALRATHAPAEQRVFCHGDFHPGNVLFNGQVIGGVVDWSATKMAPACADTAQCRAFLALHPGEDAPEQFLASYQEATGWVLDNQPFWDVLFGANAMFRCATWLPVFRDLGVDLSDDDLRHRAAAHVRLALARCT